MKNKSVKYAMQSIYIYILVLHVHRILFNRFVFTSRISKQKFIQKQCQVAHAVPLLLQVPLVCCQQLKLGLPQVLLVVQV